ncbi:hypothetical protein KUCAC02_022714, partial [Chaenocephalus aceratus]
YNCSSSNSIFYNCSFINRTPDNRSHYNCHHYNCRPNNCISYNFDPYNCITHDCNSHDYITHSCRSYDWSYNCRPYNYNSYNCSPHHCGSHKFRHNNCSSHKNCSSHNCGDMLVPVEYKSVSKWVRVPKVEDVYIYSEFLQGVLAKFNLPGLTSLMLKDSTGVEVDSDIFDELLNSSRVSFKAFTEECNVWDCEVAAILLLLHLLPPTSKGKKSPVKISAKDAAGRLVKFLR